MVRLVLGDTDGDAKLYVKPATIKSPKTYYHQNHQFHKTTIYWTTTQKNFYYSDTTQKVFYYWPTTNANLITSLPQWYPPRIWSYTQVFTDLPPTYSLQKLRLFLRTRLALDHVSITATVALDALIFLVF
jgi:hypothetical protein